MIALFRKARRARPGFIILALGIIVISGSPLARASDPVPLPPILPVQQYDPGNPDTGEVGGDIDSASYLMGRNNYMQQRFGADPGVTGNPRVKAIEQTRRNELLNPLSPVGGPTWQSLGPAPIPLGGTYDQQVPVSGRVTSIAIHPTLPDTVFIGAAQGGVWRTTNGGANWTPIFDSASSLAIGALAISPSNPTTLFVGTGERNISCDSFGGVGIYRIENAIANPVLFGPINPNGMFTGLAITKILVHPTNGSEIFVSTGPARSGIGCELKQAGVGVFRSLNATSLPSSVSFSMLNVATFGDWEYPSDMEMYGSYVLLVAVNGALNGGIYRTDNREDPAASVTFTRTFTLQQGRIEMDAGGTTFPPTILLATAGSAGRLFRSADGGTTFSQLSSYTAEGFCGKQCWYDLAVAVHPTDPARILAGGAAGSDGPGWPSTMIRSIDGATFALAQSRLHADTHAIEFSPSNPNIVYTGNDGGVWRSADSGATWSQKNSTLSITQFQSVATHPTSSILMLGGTQDNGTEVRMGTGWEMSSGGDGGYTAIDQSHIHVTDATMYHTWYADFDRNIYGRFVGQPSSATENWEVLGCYNGISNNGIGCDDNALFYPPLVLGPGSPNTVYFGTDRLYRSTDKGTTHSQVSGVVSGSISTIAIAPQNDNVRVIGTNEGKVHRTTNGTASYAEITGPWISGGNVFVSEIAIDPTNSARAYVALSRYFGNSDPHIYATSNLTSATPTWTAAALGVPDVPVNTLVIDPANPERVYAGTDIGVFRTENRGGSWIPFTDGMPRVAVFDLAIAVPNTSAQVLRAATHGRGMYEIPIGITYPKALFSVSEIEFGPRVVGGQSQAETITLTNVGTANLKMDLVSPPTTQFTLVSNNCSYATLAPGQSCGVTLRFAPTTTGDLFRSVVFRSNAINSPDHVYVSGVGTDVPSPAIGFSRTSVPFPATAAESESAAEPVTITNTGDAMLQLGSESLTGTHLSSFRIAASDCRNRMLAPGGVCTAQLRFRPTVPGVKTASYTIASNVVGSPHAVSLSGTALTKPVPLYQVSPSSVLFGDRIVNATPTIRTVTVTNGGTAPFSINGVSVSGGAAFSFGNNTCASATLAPGQTCSVEARFSPTTLGAKSGALTITATDPGSPHIVSMSGTGVAQPTPVFHNAPYSLDFGGVATGGPGDTRSVTISNDGTANLSIASSTIVGMDGSQFSMSSDGCSGQTLAPGATCIYTARFRPTSTGGKAAAVRFTTNASSTPDIYLGGRGDAPGIPGMTFSPTEVVFSSTTVQTTQTDRVIVVSSTGSAPVTFGATAIGGSNTSDFQLVGDGCSLQTVAPSGQCTLVVRFTPSVTGLRSASVGISSNAGAGVVALYGTGEAPGSPQSAISPATLSFGEQNVGTTGLYRSIIVSNTGTAPLLVAGATLEGVNAGDFALLDYCAGRSVPKGGTCPVYVSFRPTATALRSASLRVMSNAAAVVSTLSGTGTTAPVTNPGVFVSPSASSLGFARIDRPGSTATITVNSTGQVPLTISNIQLGGVSYDQFVKTQDTCTGGTFAPSRTCTVTVQFAPSRTGSHNAGLIISTNAGSPVVSLNGVGDAVAPSSSFTTPAGTLIIGGVTKLAGSTTDNHAVKSVAVSWVNMLGAAETVQATLICSTQVSCSWTADAPTVPGVYTAIAQGTDQAGNVESPGASLGVFTI